MTKTDEIIKKYLNFGGLHSLQDFVKFHIEVENEKGKHSHGTRERVCLDYIEKKLAKGMKICLFNKSLLDFTITDSIEDIERGYDEGKDLGKIVDTGNNKHDGNSDRYWLDKGIEVVFKPNDPAVRTGPKVPSSYYYHDVNFLQKHYKLNGFEFGNWLSQQDRENYVCGLGIALFDLHELLGFTPEQISLKGKLSVAFGARGHGSAAAHFEPDSFTINLTRYSRPAKEKSRPKNFSRVRLLLIDGGAGTFAHEYGHALDYFGGTYVEKDKTKSLSGDRSTNVTPNESLLKKNTLRGLMEKLLFKIVWKNNKTHSDYYKRLKKATKGKYYFQRNEIFARAFEVYVQYKLAKRKGKNVFLNHTKYNKDFYLTPVEMKKVMPEFDALIRALKKHI
ncbi:MAG: LPD1 domain-containing protein [Mucilaginibacter sp.]